MTIMIMSFVLTRIWARCVASVMPSDYNVLSFTLAKPGTTASRKAQRKLECLTLQAIAKYMS